MSTVGFSALLYMLTVLSVLLWAIQMSVHMCGLYNIKYQKMG